jgi:hypothetical protein
MRILKKIGAFEGNNLNSLQSHRIYSETFKDKPIVSVA